MKKQKGILYFMVALLLVFTYFLCTVPVSEDIVSFQICSGEQSQSIVLWKHEKGGYYVFLPSYAELEHVRVTLDTGNPIYINDVQLEDGMTCAPFSDGIAYRFSYFAWGRYRQGEITFLRSANVAAMYIETQSGNMDYIHAVKGNKESGDLTLYLPDGTIAYAGKIASIQGRGNYSWTVSEKKPYSIKLTEAADLLNLGSAEKWILLANADDSSHVRNKVIYDFADRVELKYAPESNWVDLYLNGEYAGLYLLSERNEVHAERVNIAETGSFLVSLEKRDRLTAQNYPYVSTASDQYLRVHYPENLSSSQSQELENIWQSVENAILAEDDVDPVTGKTWMAQIDLDSWVKKYLLEEIFGNIDACFISQFFYCDGNAGEKKIYAGPVWDYDHTMGSEAAWQLYAPNTLYANRYYMRDGFNTPWFHALYHKDVFYERMVEMYQNDFLPLLNGFLCEYIETCCETIAQAYELDQIRWSLGEGDIYEKAEYLQSYMRERTAFLNSIWIDERPYYIVRADNARGSIYGYYVVYPGEKLTALPVFESTENSTFLGWYNADTGEPFCPDNPIHEDITVRARWRTQPDFWLSRIEKLLPFLILLMLLLVLFGVDCKRGNLTRTRK